MSTALELTDYGAFNLSIIDSYFRQPPPAPSVAPSSLTSGLSKPEYLCPVNGCCKRYCYPGDLKGHIKRKHPSYVSIMDRIVKPRSSKQGKEHPCPIGECPCGYTREKDLRRHLKSKHGEISEAFVKKILAAHRREE